MSHNQNPDYESQLSLNSLLSSKITLFSDEYEKPSKDPLRIYPQDVDNWLNTVCTDRLLVIRGVDTDVLHGAEHAIVAKFQERFKGKGASCRCVRPDRDAPIANRRHKESKSPEASARKPAEMSVQSTLEDTPTTSKSTETAKDEKLREDLFKVSPPSEDFLDDGSEQMLITAAAYTTGFERLLDTLPEDRIRLDGVAKVLRDSGRYLVVLTTPSYLSLTESQMNYLVSFQVEADFVGPRLRQLGLERLDEVLRQQYAADVWPRDKERKTIALDQDFQREFFRFCQRGGEALEILVEYLEKPGNGDRKAYKLKRQELLDQSFERQAGWPQPDQFFDQVLIFVAAFFEKIPIEDYSRIVTKMLGDNSQAAAVPVRTLAGKDRETVVSRHKPVPLVNSWWDMRNSLVHKWGLEVTELGGRYCVGAEDAEGIRREFVNKYPFSYMELWQRMLQGGLLFDESADVLKAFTALMEQRVSNDPDHFGQRFLADILFCEEALGFPSSEELDLAERFEALRERGTQRFVVERIGSLLRSILDRNSRDVVEKSLDQLIAWQVPAITLQLLRALVNLPVARRLRLVKKVLQQSGQTYWNDCLPLLRAWLKNRDEGLDTIKWMLDFFPPAGREPNRQSIEVASAAMDVVSQWFEGPIHDGHKLLEFLGDKTDEGLSALVKLLFHPALERARNEDSRVAFFGYWLLERPARSASVEEKEMLTDLQVDMYNRFVDALPRRAGASNRPIKIDNPPVVREYQATVIADWMAALIGREQPAGTDKRALFMEILSKEVSEDVRRELFVFWQAMDEASTTGNQVLGGKEGALLRKITPTLQQGRRIFRQLMSDWVFPNKPSAAAAAAVAE